MLDCFEACLDSAKEDKEKIADLQNSVMELRQAKIELLEGLNSHNDNADVEGSETWKTKCQEKDDQIQRLNFDLVASKSKLSQVEKELRDKPTNWELTEMASQKEKLEKELEEVKRSIADGSHSSNLPEKTADISQERTLRDLESERDQLLIKNQELNSHLLTVLANNADPSEIDQLRIENQVLRENLQSMTNEAIQAASGDNSRGQSDMAINNAQLTAANVKLQARVDDLEGQMHDCQNKSTLSISQKDKIIKEKLMLEVSVMRHDRENAKLKSENAKLKEKVNELEARPEQIVKIIDVKCF